jgi:hypothetical protein
MTSELRIKRIFVFANGNTNVVGKFFGPELKISGRRASLVNADGAVVQEVVLIGEVLVRGKTSHEDERVFETVDRVSISATEAESGTWRLVIDD